MMNPLASGFRAAGVAAGIKESGGKDVALIVNDGPTHVGVGVFTKNRVKAAPVLWSQQVVADAEVRAVALNSGGANACTGPEGFADTHHTAEHVGHLLACGAGEVAVCSTGLIGVRLPMSKLDDGLSAAAAALSDRGGPDAASAILTTDSVAKTARVVRSGVVVAGMAKGAGMLAPELATMLVVITTDALVAPAQADAALRAAAARTFDRVDSDGCMSTNDTVLLLASGASELTPDPVIFGEMVEEVCADLASQLVADAEGASKQISIEVRNAATEGDALVVARTVARSNLFKCAMHGEDPNWGRVISAVGTTEAVFDPNLIAVAINDVWVCRNGMAADDRNRVNMAGENVSVIVDLNAGASVATVLTNDLTSDYVYENSAYSS